MWGGHTSETTGCVSTGGPEGEQGRAKNGRTTRKTMILPGRIESSFEQQTKRRWTLDTMGVGAEACGTH